MYNIETSFLDAKKSSEVIDLFGNKKLDVLVIVKLQYTLTDGDIKVSTSNDIRLNVNNLSGDFKQLSQVSEDTMLEWAINSMTQKQWDGVYYVLKKEISRIKKKPVGASADIKDLNSI